MYKKDLNKWKTNVLLYERDNHFDDAHCLQINLKVHYITSYDPPTSKKKFLELKKLILYISLEG